MAEELKTKKIDYLDCKCETFSHDPFSVGATLSFGYKCKCKVDVSRDERRETPIDIEVPEIKLYSGEE